MFGWFANRKSKEQGRKSTGAMGSTGNAGATGTGRQAATKPGSANRRQARSASNGVDGQPRIHGHVDPDVIRRAAGAVQGKQASETIKRLIDEPEGAAAMAGTLRKWMRDGSS